jgi:hypothetical protein
VLPIHPSDHILPNLIEVDFSDTFISAINLAISSYCPLLEKLSSSNNASDIYLCGTRMRDSKNLKEINMDNAIFTPYYSTDEENLADFNNHQKIFLFHRCCKSLERVSIRNMNYDRHRFDVDNIFTQNVLIKFVRNAPLTLHWFRSDLTLDNMTMLRMERPGIELLN